jgi:hypothetical protein
MTAPNETLRTILPIAGWGDGQAADVVFTGGADPVLPTPFRIGAAGAAALAASGLAATELWRARTGRRQRVTVDLRQATAALRSSQYIRLAGTGVSSARNAIMGFYPTRDGRWSYLHCNFPNHRAAALRVLGVAEDRDAVARAAHCARAGSVLKHISATYSVCSPPQPNPGLPGYGHLKICRKRTSPQPAGEELGVRVQQRITGRPPPRRHSASKTRVNALKAPTLPTRGRVKTEFAARAGSTSR